MVRLRLLRAAGNWVWVDNGDIGFNLDFWVVEASVLGFRLISCGFVSLGVDFGCS